jgi:hypothetical protein
MSVILLVLVLLIGLAMIPFGLPGTLIIACAALGYSLLVPHAVGMFTVVMIALLFIAGEAIEWILTARYTRKYGGSRRAGWGAVIGGMVGAFLGVPVPIVGSVIGAFVGAFIGAFVAELSQGSGGGAATRVATGALIGRALSAAVKVGLGVAMASWILFAAIT